MIKEPNVAGAFYEADPQKLSQYIEAVVQSVGPAPFPRGALIALAPHAGYVYSGGVAAHTFNALRSHPYKTIVIIGPSHFFAFEGLAVWPHGGFRTPLGTIAVDGDFSQRLMQETAAVVSPEFFEQEHCIEVELPFVQKFFPAAEIVPVLMGRPDHELCQGLAAALHKVIGSRKDVLVLVSSDMAHYHSYEAAKRMDALTLDAIRAVDVQGFFEGCAKGRMEMCGFGPVATVLTLAGLRGIRRAEILQYANSGDVTGDKGRVVGYAAAVFYEEKTNILSLLQKKELLSRARGVIDSFVRTGQIPALQAKDKIFEEVRGVFVTLHKHGQLRGCIGQVIGQGPLGETTREMAVAAACRDPRFDPVVEAELQDIRLEISVLSRPRRIKDISEIVLGRDGVMVISGSCQAVFLPQVAQETGWSKEEFLSQLCRKAGLVPNAWQDPNILLHTFTADIFSE